MDGTFVALSSTGYSCWKLYVTSLVVVKVAVAQWL